MLALLSGLTVVWVGFSSGWPGPRLRLWERILDDQLLQLRGPRQAPVAVVVVAVEDPLPRSSFGLLSERLLHAGASAVAIDDVFARPSRHGSIDDQALAAVLARHPGRISLAAEWLEPNDNRAAGGLTLLRPQSLFHHPGASVPIGVTTLRRPPPGEPLRHPEAYISNMRARGLASPAAISSVLLQRAGRSSRQLDALRELNPYGPERSLTRLLAVDILDPKRWLSHPLRVKLRGALVLIGPVVSEGAAGYPTAFGTVSRLELLATAAANSLAGDGLAAWPSAAWARAVLAGGLVLVAALLTLSRSPLSWRLAILGLSLITLAGAAGWMLIAHHRWLPLLQPAGGLMLLGLLHGASAYARKEGERQRLRRTFERYVAPSVVAEILADPQAAQGVLQGRCVSVSVLFCDLKGFTALTSRRSAAGEIGLHINQLNDYLGAMVAVINSYGGTVDKFIGDAVMAVFGAPLGRGTSQEAVAAISCAKTMMAALKRLNEGWREKGLEPLSMGIGIASGEVIEGQIGSPQRLEFTVIGNTVNRASRLQALTRSLPVDVVVDAETAALTSTTVPLSSAGTHQLRGLHPEELFTPQE